MNKRRILITGVLSTTLGIALVGLSQKLVSTSPIGPVWQLQQSRLPLYAGQGVALRPDGQSVAFMGLAGPDQYDNTLFLLNLETGTQSPLLIPDRTHSVAPFLADQASFSPDGNRLILVRRGQNWHYPSDIYSIGTDGSGLVKLTESLPYTNKRGNPADPTNKEYWVGASYQRYYYSPRYSPDGSLILLHVYDVVGQSRDFTAIMKPDGSDLQILAEGQPLCWSADGKAVYYTNKGLLMRMDVASRATQTVPVPALENRAALGRMAGRDWLAFRLDNGRIGWYHVGAGKPAPEFLGEWSVPAVKLAGAEQLTLKGFDWSRSNEVLLWYQGEHTERFEVVRIFDPTSIR